MNRRHFVASAAGASGLALTSLTVAQAATSSSSQATRLTHDTVVTRHGIRLFVRDWGSGEPVLFMSGWTLPSDFWGYQMAALADQGFRCISYDRRGHGRSADPGGGYNFETLADDLASVIEALDLKNLTLVGHSMASGEMATYLSRHGQRRVRKAVFVAPTTPFLMKTDDNPVGVDRNVLAASRKPFSMDFPGWAAANAAPFFTPETSAQMIEWGKSMMLQTSLQAAIECSRALAETDFRPHLAAVKIPALVIHGDKDASAPLALTGERTAALIRGAKLVVYEGAPHGLPLTHVSRLNGDLLKFIRDN